jgi:hypothetical protein
LVESAVARGRELAIAAVVGAVSVVTMAIDHLVGTESEGDESPGAEPGVFVGTALFALALVGALFRFLVAPAHRNLRSAATKAIVCAVLAIVTLPLLFLAVPFPFAGAGIALGLLARDGPHPRLGAGAAVAGTLVILLGLVAYVGEAVA